MGGSANKSRPSDSALQTFLAFVVGLGTCLVLFMATVAFGPSGFGFGLVIAIVGYAFMARRYRFSLRTFLIVTTVFGVWLGLKVGRDLKQQRAVSGIIDAGGHFKVHDRWPDFPWGIWAERYDLDFYKLKQPLSDEQLGHLTNLSPSSMWWLNVENTGIADERINVVARFRDVEYLSLANDTFANGQVIPERPQNRLTDAGIVELRGLKKLKGIDLSGTDATDNCLAILLEMPRLVWIKLNGTKVTGAGMARLASFKDLMMLELNGCPISAEGFKELSQLTNVTCLGLYNTGMRDQDLDGLNRMRQLDILRLGSNRVSNKAVMRFTDEHPRCKIDR